MALMRAWVPVTAGTATLQPSSSSSLRHGTVSAGLESLQGRSCDGRCSRAVGGCVLAALGAGTRWGRSGRKRHRHASKAPGQKVRMHFFNFGGPEEEVDPEDPGRVAVCKEYQNSSGSFVCAERSDFGWAVVSEHDASEQDGYWPGGSEGDVKQVWRELRLAADKSDTPPGAGEGTGQTVVKVSLRSDATPVQVPYCMPLAYAKTMAAVCMSGQHLQGALPLEEVPMQRVLVVGLGGGSLPVWLHHTFPEGRISVDALEIDPAVIKVASNAMGFPADAIRPAAEPEAAAADALAGAGGQALRVYAVAGEAFLEALGAAAGADGDYKYDMVFIDAFDKAGKVPEVLVDPEGPFLTALQQLLSPRATVALNLLVGMTGTGSSGGPKEIEAMVYAVHGACCDTAQGGQACSVRTPMDESSGNQVYGFLRAGRGPGQEEGVLKEALKRCAEAVNSGFPPDSLGSKIRFDFARRVNFAWQDWEPPATPPKSLKELAAPAPESDGKQGGGFFGF
eukprot:TRINITY_DN76736_c0_g1_i1.p1 TRINITY_DN76736_c0_g1~~TRINITY_DN76736_c0_g1_i1.p1  ORF type:complete len:517 (-),score=108.60 TRINITY_DN76736_c0_g1_i1:35-1558(-)